ncbi:hypothetical protein [Stenotrophomonas maltophilia]|uniref:hypothetical protein n=1 Tax=Stenotrophomonas maltophilia TaxID=40324 RepID=UPI002158D0A6|nr:hypothetical protein [Stenotrophomonas maltophilia]
MDDQRLRRKEAAVQDDAGAGCPLLAGCPVVLPLTPGNRGKPMRIHRPFIFFAGLAMAALAILAGVLVLIYGLGPTSTRCGRLCGMGFAISQYFGWRAYEVASAMTMFGGALLAGHTALSEGLSTQPRAKRGRRRRRKRRSRS